MTEEARAPEEGSAERQAPEQEASEPSTPRPRRRRGGRGRGRGSRSQAQRAAGTAEAPADAAPPTTGEAPPEQTESGSGDGAAAADGDQPGAEGSGPRSTSSGSRRRRRRPSSRKPATTSEDGDVASEGSTAVTSDPPGDASPGAASDAADADDRADPTEASDAPEGGTSSSTKRRRRRRRRKKPSDSGDGEAAADPSSEAKPDTKPASKPADGRRSRAKPKQKEDEAPPATRTARRRRGVVTRRRREPEIRPERRLDKIMLITENGDRDQIAVAEGRELVEHYVTRAGARSMVGNVYLGRVQNVLPGMEAAFIDLGRGRNAVLYAGEVSHDEDVEEQPRRIEQVLKPGQPIVVQVTKDPMGGKGARLTGQISLAGRYLVYVPGGSASGISRRLPEKERNRLRGIMKEIRPSGAGVIIRTAAEGATPEGLEEDLERLKKTWESIRRKSRRGKPPKVLYEEPELTIRVLRDVFSAVEFREVVTDSESVYERVTAYLKEVAPDILDRVRLHQGPLPVFEEYHVHEQIHKALERKVWLPSGGYLIIDRTEAMTVVDVNTGKAVGKTNLEETVVQTNLEAAREIARQLRLRDIGGIIVIDFIDMLLQANRNKVIRALKEEMAQDKTRSQVFDITPLGLLEVTRKRVSAGLVESFSQTCPTCEGRGILVSLDTEGN